MLQSVSAVTFSVPDLDRSSRAFQQCLGHRARVGATRADVAAAWGVPGLAGRPQVLLQPASGDGTRIRLIQAPATTGYRPMVTPGWNAAELHVADVMGLAESLEGSPFQVIGGPRDLLGGGEVVALQVRGPGDEILYLTEMKDPGYRKTYGHAQSPVDRVFIVVLGTDDMDGSRHFYGQISRELTPTRSFAIRVLASALGLAADTPFSIASALCKKRGRIELDQLPRSVQQRPGVPGELPPGLSMVSFTVADAAGVCWSDGPDQAPYCGRPFGILRGPCGEWLELIQDDC
ncbi:MAG: hypothetical protein QNJ40_13700 [Xanthomonadales bacterium]|nr:hypothetical protein [Xanthomonadales bacterium]